MLKDAAHVLPLQAGRLTFAGVLLEGLADRMTGAKIVKYWEALKAIRQPLEQHTRECYQVTFPIRGIQFNSSLDQSPESIQQEAATLQAQLTDSTAADSAQVLASTLVSGMTPANSLWFGVQAGDGDSDSANLTIQINDDTPVATDVTATPVLDDDPQNAFGNAGGARTGNPARADRVDAAQGVGGGGDRHLHCLVADLADRIGLGHGDLLVGPLQAALDRGGEVGLGMLGGLLGLELGMGDDLVGLGLDLAMLALELGKSRLGILAQTPHLIQLAADPVGPAVQLPQQKLMDAKITQQPDEQDEGNTDDEMAVIQK